MAVLAPAAVFRWRRKQAEDALTRLERLASDAEFWDRFERHLARELKPLVETVAVSGANVGARLVSQLLTAQKAEGDEIRDRIRRYNALTTTASRLNFVFGDAGIAGTIISEIVSNAVDVTLSRLQSSIARARIEGLGADYVLAQMQPYFDSPRAVATAVTETTRVFGAGSQAMYRALDVAEWEWQTVEDPWVEEICQARNGEIFSIEQDFEPAHVHCRCFPKPIVSEPELSLRHLSGRHDQSSHGRRSAEFGLRGRLVKEGGFTFQPATGDVPSSGLMVSDLGSERIIDRPVRTADIKTYIKENRSTFEDPDSYFGAWTNPEDGKTFFDVSHRYKTRDAATKAAISNKQEAFYDIAKNETVFTRAREKALEIRALSPGDDGRRDPDDFGVVVRRDSLRGGSEGRSSQFVRVVKHLAGRHDQSTHGRGTSLSFPPIMGSPEAIEEAAVPHFKDWGSSLSPTESAAIKMYTDTSTEINSSLRFGQTPPAATKDLDSALEKASNKSPAMTVYRGMREDPNWEAGDNFSDKAYVSTSLNKHTAGAFAGRAAVVHNENIDSAFVIAEIRVPSRSRAAAVNAVPSVERHEAEILLGRGSRFRITGSRIEEHNLAPAKGFESFGPSRFLTKTYTLELLK